MSDTTRTIDAGGGDEPLSKRRVRDLCRRVRNGVLSRNLASEEEVDALDPGEDGPYNAQWHYYAQLWRIFEREKYVTYGSEYASHNLLKALDSEPVELLLTSGHEVTICPKSYDALCWFREAYYWLNWFNESYVEIQRQVDENVQIEGTKDPIGLTERIYVATQRRSALIMWACCTGDQHLPWPYGQLAPDEAPAEWRDLAPIDVQSIENAMYKVNAGRLAFLPKPGEKRGKGITPEQFFATRNKQTGRPISELRRDRDLAAEVAQVTLASHTDEDAA